MGTFTTNLNLYEPAVGETGWGTAVNANFSTLDNALVNPTPTVTGTLTPAGLVDISGVSAGQVKFPATQNPSANVNTLDDYEEGTWTPTLGGTATYTAQIGKYTKVGNVVTVWCSLAVNVIGTGSTTVVNGLPFVPDEEAHGAVHFSTIAVNTISVIAYTSTSTTEVFIASRPAAAANNNVATAVFGNGTVVNFTLTYKKT